MTCRAFLAAAATVLGDAPAPNAALPRVRLGKHLVSRLICGNNCFNSNSQTSVPLNEEMCRYYTADQVIRTLRRCQRIGIDTWRGSSPAPPCL